MRARGLQEEEYEAAEELLETDESLGLKDIVDVSGIRRGARGGPDVTGLGASGLVFDGDGRGLLSKMRIGDMNSDDEDAVAPAAASASTSSDMFEEAVESPVRFQILKDEVDNVKKACLHMDPPFPLMREYDFKACSLPVLDLRLRSPELLREYVLLSGYCRGAQTTCSWLLRQLCVLKRLFVYGIVCLGNGC